MLFGTVDTIWLVINLKMNIRAQLKILIWKAITPRSSYK